MTESKQELNQEQKENKNTREVSWLGEALKCLEETRVQVHTLALIGPTPNDLHRLLTLLSQSQLSPR